MDESFVPLAVWLRAPLAPAAPAEVRPQSNAGEGEDAAGGSDLIADLTLLRLAALEAFERARGRLLERLARDVLGRELMLAPADLQTLAERALEAFAESEPLTLAIAPADAERVTSVLPLRIDPALNAGDLVVEVRDGELDARFALRLGAALAAADAPM